MIEKKKLQVELIRVQAARAEMEYQIMQREEDIKRLQNHIDVQTKREQELQDQLDKLT